MFSFYVGQHVRVDCWVHEYDGKEGVVVEVDDGYPEEDTKVGVMIDNEVVWIWSIDLKLMDSVGCLA